jgi:autophagy-related protein 18
MMIPAHEAPLAALTFNPGGTRLATASERGTVIRVFSVDDGARLIEFRRGVKRCATVYCLSFSQDSHYLVLSSNTETIHVFRFDEEQQQQQEQQQQEQQRQQQQQQQAAAGYVNQRNHI